MKVKDLRKSGLLKHACLYKIAHEQAPPKRIMNMHNPIYYLVIAGWHYYIKKINSCNYKYAAYRITRTRPVRHNLIHLADDPETLKKMLLIKYGYDIKPANHE